VVFSAIADSPVLGALRMGKDADLGLDWARLPAIATVARLLCRELTLQNGYLRLVNRILKEKVQLSHRFETTVGHWEKRSSAVRAARG
jgi:hypothetical protein